jgi:hypothetical protein
MNSLEKYKLLFLSLNNIKDINKLCNLLNLSNNEKIYINNYFNSLNLPKKISYNDFLGILDDLHNLKYKEDVMENLYKLGNKTTDINQINSIIKIGNTKQEKYSNIITNNIKEKNKWFNIKQNCPHCNITCKIDFESDYAICGYNDTRIGYNWEGCGRDWCTKCGKKLCKKWNENNLFIIENRFHDNECCLKYCKLLGNNYLLDFCQCYNEYVDRN